MAFTRGPHHPVKDLQQWRAPYASNLKALGTTASDAAQITSSFVVVDSATTTFAGVRLPQPQANGQPIAIVNQTGPGIEIFIYPHPNGTINGQAANVGVRLYFGSAVALARPVSSTAWAIELPPTMTSSGQQAVNTLTVGGATNIGTALTTASLFLQRQAQTADFVYNGAQAYVTYTGTAGCNITLPRIGIDVASNEVIIVKDEGGNAGINPINGICQGVDTFEDGSTSKALIHSNYGCVVLWPGGSPNKWRILDQYAPGVVTSAEASGAESRVGARQQWGGF